MTENMRMATEVSFNILYLIVVWGLVILMTRRLPRVAAGNRSVARLVRGAFALLALGDTGHVGFRVLAYAQGNLAATFTFLGREFGLVGLGALSTAITVTIFYVLMLEIWRQRFSAAYGWFGMLLLAVAVLRLVLMIPPTNQWNNTIPPQPWSLIRNVPLMVQGLGVAYLILRDALRMDDRAFIWIGIMILISYACYIPVILLVRRIPLIGMLMIPKTMAYVGVGIIAYRSLFAPVAQYGPSATAPSHS